MLRRQCRALPYILRRLAALPSSSKGCFHLAFTANTYDPLMALTGGLFLTLVAVLFSITTFAAIFFRPVWGPVRARTLQRALLVLLAQGLAVLLSAILVNNWGSFYGSWSDLFGGSTTLITRDAGGGTEWGNTSPRTNGATLPMSTGLTPTTWSKPSDYAAVGQIGSVTLVGRRSKLSSKSLIYLPPQYFQRQYAQSTFPVVEVFTGYPGDVRQIVDRIKYPEGLLAAMKTGSARPMILAFFNPSLAPPRDTECTNVPGGPQVGTYFLQDVPHALRKHLRVTASGWGLMGHSTGGYCATKFAMLAPGLFSTVVSLSGNYQAIRDDTTGDLWGGSQNLRNLNDPQWRLQHLPVPKIAVLASVGSLERGADGVSNTQHFIGLVRPPMIAKLVIVQGGAHNFSDYLKVLPRRSYGFRST